MLNLADVGAEFFKPPPHFCHVGAVEIEQLPHKLPEFRIRCDA